MRNWIIYPCSALIIFTAIALPILSSPEYDERNDHEQLHRLINKVKHMEIKLTTLHEIMTERQEQFRQAQITQNYNFLRLTKEQNKAIIKILKKSQPKTMWQDLQTRNQIHSQLTPEQQKNYLEYLKHTGKKY